MAERASERLEAIVLAAGAGTRFGGDKLLAPFRGRPLIAGALDAAFAAPVRSVTVAVRAGDLALAEQVKAHARRLGRAGDLRLIVAAEAAEGLGATLRGAVASLAADAAGVLVFLGDMPEVPAGLAADLARAWAGGAAIAAPRFDGRRGHPVLFDRAAFAALRAATGDTGAQALLAAAGDSLTLVEAPDRGVLFDIDRVEDLAPPP